MGNQQWVHFAVIILVLAMSAISWAIRQFRAYQAKQEVKTAAQRRREQMLRTGRTDSTPVAPTMRLETPTAPSVSVHDDARRKLMELAAKRQAQLEEMARRAAAGGGGSPGSAGPRVGGGGSRGTFTPPRPVPPAPPPPRPQPTQRPIPAHRQAQQAPRPGRQAPTPAAVAENRRRQEAKARAEAARERSEREQYTREKATVEALAVKSNAEYTKATGSPSIASSEITDASAMDLAADTRRSALAAAIGNLRMGAGSPAATLETWRRAIILTEILGSPPALRDPDRAL
jgi:hypothetical protein